MKVGTSFLARILGGSTAAVPKDSENAFGGVLSTVADDAAGQAGTASSKPLEASDVRSGGKKASDTDDETDATADDAAPAKSDQPATPLPDGSLLALVQSAALPPQAGAAPSVSPMSSRTSDSTATASSVDRMAMKPVTAPDIGTASASGTAPMSRLVKAAADPLVSDVTMETHLAPVSLTTTGRAQGTARVDVAAPPTAASMVVPALAPASAPRALDEAALVEPVANRIVAKTSVVAEPVAEATLNATDAAGPTEQTTVAPAAQTDAKPGQSDTQAGSGSAKQDTPDTVDQATADAPGHVVAQPDTSLVLQQKLSLSAPTRAVAEAVTSLAAQATHAATVATTGPARTMLLQLSPGGLGTVSVRLHLTGSTLDVSLTASHAGTASLLDHDRAALTSALGDKDYRLNSLVIQGGDAASTPGGSSASTDSSGNRSASQSMADRHSGESGRGGARDSATRQPAIERDRASPADPDARGDALFV